MQRDGETKQPGVEEKESNDTEECFTVFEIDFRFGRNERRYEPRIDDIIQDP
jgi:hypothetical protein